MDALPKANRDVSVTVKPSEWYAPNAVNGWWISVVPLRVLSFEGRDSGERFSLDYEKLLSFLDNTENSTCVRDGEGKT